MGRHVGQIKTRPPAHRLFPPRRDAGAVCKRLVLTAEDVPDRRACRANGGRAVAKKMAGRKKRTA